MSGQENLEQKRLETLRQYRILDSPPEKVFDDLTKTAAQICRTSFAAICFLDEKRQWFKSKFGFEADWAPRENAFCAHTIRSPRPLVVPDARKDERFCGNPAVLGPPFLRFYAGAPLITEEGVTLGTICVFDSVSRALTHSQLGMLEALARQVMAYLEFKKNYAEAESAQEELQHAVSALMRAHSRNVEQKEKLAQSEKMAILGEMASAVIHEINNPLAVVQFQAAEIKDLARNPATRTTTREISSVCEDIERTIGKIARIMRSVQSFGRCTEEEPFTQVSVQEIVGDVFKLFKMHMQDRGIQLVFEGDSRQMTIECRETQIFQVLVNLIHNAADAVESLTKPWIRVEARDLGESIELSVTDSGSGLPPRIRARLFTPFFTTKSKGRGTGLGLRISKRIVDSHQGELEYDPRSANTRFVLRLPKKQRQRE